MSCDANCSITRSEAYRTIRELSPTPEEARDTFRIAEDAVARGHSWSEALDAFRDVLAVDPGDRQQIDDAQSALSLAVGLAPTFAPDNGSGLGNATAWYTQLRRSENNSADARSTSDLILTHADELGIGPRHARDVYARILASVGGNGATKTAHDTFSEIVSASKDTRRDIETLRALTFEVAETEANAGENKDDARRLGLQDMSALAQASKGSDLANVSSAYFSLREAENTRSDAWTAFRLVERAVKEHGCSPQEAAEDFIETLKTEGGNGNSEAAREAFKLTWGLS